MAAAAPAALDLNLQSSYGLLLIGCFLSAAVWGVTFVQTVLYSFMYTGDPLRLRLMVWFLMAIDTANEILVLKSVWPPLILHWGRADILAKSEGTLELIHHVWVAAIVAAGVQSYYVWRIFILNGRKRLLPSLLMVLVAWQVVGLAPYNFLVFGKAPVSAGRQTTQLTAVAISLRATGAATDIIIAVSMVYLLLKPPNRRHFTSTQTLVYRLLVLSINTGVWTAALAVVDFACIWALPTDFTFTVFELPLCSLYLSTLLVNLNARRFISETDGTTIDLSDRSGEGGGSGGAAARQSRLGAGAGSGGSRSRGRGSMSLFPRAAGPRTPPAGRRPGYPPQNDPYGGVDYTPDDEDDDLEFSANPGGRDTKKKRDRSLTAPSRRDARRAVPASVDVDIDVHPRGDDHDNDGGKK